jgi:hypothetical protein
MWICMISLYVTWNFIFDGLVVITFYKTFEFVWICRTLVFRMMISVLNSTA